VCRSGLLIWDNASWHVSRAVRTWVRAHNRAVKRAGQGVRIVMSYLPVKSPCLNPIEPKWVHSKRAIVEPARRLTAHEVAERVCAYQGCPHEPHLTLPDPILDKAS
jgi:DDE superfamily endonuclease